MTTLIVLALTFPSTGMTGDCCEEPIVIQTNSTPYQTTDLISSGYDLYSECELMGIMHNDVGFEYVAPSDGQVTVTTCDPDSFDTSIIVYQAPLGDCSGSQYLSCSGDAPAGPACQPYHSITDFSVSEGQTYMIRVGGWQEDSFGTGTLTVTYDDQSSQTYCPADINKDRSIDGADLTILLGDWGSMDSPADLTGGSHRRRVRRRVRRRCRPRPAARRIGSLPTAGGLAGPGQRTSRHRTSTMTASPRSVTRSGSATSVARSSSRSMPGTSGRRSPINRPPPSGRSRLSTSNAAWSATSGPAAGSGTPPISPPLHRQRRRPDLTDDYYAFVDVWFDTPVHGYITGTNNQGRASRVETHDGGLTWTTRKTNQSGQYWKMGFATGSFGYGVCSGGTDIDKWVQIYDGGDTWTDRVFTDGFHANGIGFLNEQVGWIGGYPSHTLQTSNGGQTWEPIQIDRVYGDVINKFLKVDESTMYSVGNRVYRYSNDRPGLRCAEAEKPFRNNRCKVRAVTRGTTPTISYTVPEDGHVVLNIFIRGSLLEDRPVDDFQKVGNYRVELHTPEDAPELFASIETGDYRCWTEFERVPASE